MIKIIVDLNGNLYFGILVEIKYIKNIFVEYFLF